MADGQRLERSAGISAIARTPCGDSVSAALANSSGDDLGEFDAARSRSAPSSAAPRGASASCGATSTPRTRSGERSSSSTARTPFGDEQLLALARLSAAEVAGESEQFQ